MSPADTPRPRRPLAKNKRAFHDFEILDRLECGIALVGTEVKSLRNGKVSLQEAYCRFDDRELWVIGMNIPEYSHGNQQNHEPTRSRKLLAHRQELRQLHARVTEKGLTLVPLAIYFSGALVKLEVGLGRGKKRHDKRQDLRKKEDQREIDRARR